MADEQGDLGGESAPGLSERRLEERALRERWPISDAVRLRIVERLCKVIERDDLDERHAIGAARALISADKLNLEQAKFDHATKPAEQLDDDYEIDLGSEEDPAQRPA